MKQETFTLITGASTGFGRSLALECARRGQNLVLVSLPGKELLFLADFIRKNYSVTVFHFEKDLSVEKNCIELHGQIKRTGIAINILINNAGIGGTDYFEEKELSFYRRQLQVNVMAPTFITYLFLDDLKKNGPSFILNVSSLAGFFCLPKKQVYAGSKSFLLSFSGCLWYELKKHNISVSVVCPGAMNTTAELTYQNKKASHLLKWSVMNPEQVAGIALKKMLQRKKVIVPGFWNNVIRILDRILPEKIRQFLIEGQLKRIENYVKQKNRSSKAAYPVAA